MADARDQTSGCTGFQRAAKMKSEPSTRLKNSRTWHQKPSYKMKLRPKPRPRVNIGLAFERWRVLRAEAGLISDAEVALYLLNE